MPYYGPDRWDVEIEEMKQQDTICPPSVWIVGKAVSLWRCVETDKEHTT